MRECPWVSWTYQKYACTSLKKGAECNRSGYLHTAYAAPFGLITELDKPRPKNYSQNLGFHRRRGIQESYIFATLCH